MHYHVGIPALAFNIFEKELILFHDDYSASSDLWIFHFKKIRPQIGFCPQIGFRPQIGFCLQIEESP